MSNEFDPVLLEKLKKLFPNKINSIRIFELDNEMTHDLRHMLHILFLDNVPDYDAEAFLQLTQNQLEKF